MPIYEYDCDACGKRTEAIQRLGDRPLKICPHCGGRLKKAFSAPAIQFKGSGWYVNDYSGARGEQKQKEASADSKEGAAESKESGGEKADKAEKKDKDDKKAKPKPKAKSGD
ncbi:MAG TPA: FmdB family zinc ribbon protein [Thermoanaerobaculia bacterium]|nr:FmdB family zinc ribbon protein [Thermoanaerobaculia bacterium]